MLSKTHLTTFSALSSLLIAASATAEETPLAGPWFTGSAAATAGTPSFSPDNTSDSFTWGSGSAGGGSSSRRGILWTYFDDIILAADHESVSVSFTAQWPVNAVAGDQAFRFGLFNNGGSTRMSNLNNANTDAAFSNSLGYFATINLGGSTGSNIRVRSGGSNNVLSIFDGGQSTVGGGLANPNATGANTPHQFTLTIARNSATEYRLTVTAASGGVSTATTTIVSDTFNTFYLQNTQENELDSIVFSNIRVTFSDEPLPPPPDPRPMALLGPPLLGLDFNRTDQLGSPSQSFFRVVGGSATQSENESEYVKSFGHRQVTVTRPDGLDFEFCGANGDASRAIPGGDTSISFLVSDFIATRGGAIDLSITGLEAGDYIFRSWHLDTITTGPLGFARGADANTPNTIEARIGGEPQDSITPTSLGSSGLATTYIENAQIPRIDFEFSHDGTSPLIIELRSLAPDGDDNFLLLNGFAIHSATAAP